MEYLSARISQLSAEADLSHHFLFSLTRCGFFLCTQGSVALSFNQSIYHLEQGSMYIYMPSASVCAISQSDDADGLIVESALDDILPVINKVVSPENLLLIRTNPYVKLRQAEFAQLQQAIDALRGRMAGERNEVLTAQQRMLKVEILRTLLQAFCYEMFFIYFSHTPERPVLANDKKVLVYQNFMLDIYKHYKREREIAFYASQQCLSERYFSLIVKQVTGQTASFWVVQMVMAEAKRLLESTSLTVKEIAFELNFSTQSFFGKYFKHYAGLSPSDYRKQLFQL